VRFNYTKELALPRSDTIVLLMSCSYMIMPVLFPIINVVGGLVASVPVVLVSIPVQDQHGDRPAVHSVHEDLTASISSGMSLPLA